MLDIALLLKSGMAHVVQRPGPVPVREREEVQTVPRAAGQRALHASRVPVLGVPASAGRTSPAACHPTPPLAARGAVILLIAAGLPAACAASRPPAADLAVPESMPPAKSLPAAPLRNGRVDGTPGAPVTAEALAAAVRADAARMLGIADPAVLTVSVEAVIWSDGSLGCPRPGVLYTQALVPGWLVLVSNGAQRWHYHASRAGAWTLCPAGLAGRPVPRDVTR